MQSFYCSFSPSCIFALLLFLPLISAQSISTSMSLPSMQWINLSSRISSTRPPPLVGACLTGNPQLSSSSSSQSLVLVGGRTSASVPSSETYVLDLSSFNWSQPSPPDGLTSIPPARSHALCAYDSASNYRNAVVLSGGLGSTAPLSDFWVYDSLYNFWSQVNGSTLEAQWNQAGGIDPTYSSPTSQTNALVSSFGITNSNSFSTNVSATAISGQLSSNIDTVSIDSYTLSLASNAASGSWGSASALLPGSLIVSFAGCNTSTPAPTPLPTNVSTDCPDGLVTSASILSYSSTFNPAQAQSQTASWSSVQYCPAPRIGASMAPNLNAGSTSYAKQVFLIGGIIDDENWIESPSGQGGISNGEVAVLDTSTGTWARVIPSGDKMGPRSGAAVFAASSAVSGLGSTASGVTDIIVYGGRDPTSGDFLDELWVLRLGASEDPPTYINECAALRGAGSGSNSKNPSKSSTSSFNVGDSHGVLSGLSVALILPAIVLWKLNPQFLIISTFRTALLIFLGIISFAIGISGTAIGFSTAKQGSMDAQKNVLHSKHVQAGLAFFILAYFIAPVCILILYLARSRTHNDASSQVLEMNESQGSCEKRGPDHIEFVPAIGVNSNEFPESNVESGLHSAASTQGRASGRYLSSSTTNRSIFNFYRTTNQSAEKSFEVLNRPAVTRSQSVRSPTSRPVSRGSQMSGPHDNSYDKPASGNNNNRITPRNSIYYPPSSPSSPPPAPINDRLSTYSHHGIAPLEVIENVLPSSNEEHNIDITPSRKYRLSDWLELGFTQAIVIFGIILLLVSMTPLSHSTTRVVLFVLFIVLVVLYYCSLAFTLFTSYGARPLREVVYTADQRLHLQKPTSAHKSRTLNNDPFMMSSPRQTGRRAFSMSLESLRDVRSDEDIQRNAETTMSARDVYVVTAPRRQLRVTN